MLAGINNINYDKTLFSATKSVYFFESHAWLTYSYKQQAKKKKEIV